MRIVVQRTKEAKVTVEGQVVGEIDFGMVLLVCFEKGDTQETLQAAVTKILNMRIFDDEKGKMNLNIGQTGGQILCVSQFTLAWRGDKGHRPGFDYAMSGPQANMLYGLFCNELQKHVPVSMGRFGSYMQVHIINDGPVTFFLEIRNEDL